MRRNAAGGERKKISSSVTQTTSPDDKSKPSLVFMHKSDETKEDAEMTQGCLFLQQALRFLPPAGSFLYSWLPFMHILDLAAKLSTLF